MKCLNCGVRFELNKKRPAKKYGSPDAWRGFKGGRFYCTNRCRMYRSFATARDAAHAEMERLKADFGPRFKTIRGNRWYQTLERNLAYYRQRMQ